MKEKEEKKKAGYHRQIDRYLKEAIVAATAFDRRHLNQMR